MSRLKELGRRMAEAVIEDGGVKPMRYELGFHSSDARYCHVTLVDSAGGRDDLFDVSLYWIEEGETGDGETEKSLAALKRLIELANKALA